MACSDSEKQDVEEDERRLMTVERRAMARCDGGERAGIGAKSVEMSPHYYYSTFGKVCSFNHF